MASVSIPVLGTKKYRMAVNAFAQETGTNMATITRQALDEKLGKNPRFRELVSFFEPDVNSDSQTTIPENAHA